MSEIPEYSAVDKSKKRRPVQQPKDAEDTLPHDRKKMLLKRKPLPYETAYRKNDDTLEVKNAADNTLPADNFDINPARISAKGASYEEPRCLSTPKCLVVLLLFIVICMMVLTVVFALAVHAVASDSSMKSEIKALQEQLQALQQNASEEYSILRQINGELSQNYSIFKVEVQQLLSDNCPYSISSCASLPSSCPSGHYLLATSTSAAHVYCDMTRTCGNVTGGWMRVGYLNMMDDSSLCPAGLRQQNHDDIRTCSILNSTNASTCSSVFFPTNMANYSHVCGRISAYQFGNTNAFRFYYLHIPDINSEYVDGISLTYGKSPLRHHIWTLAAALDNNYNEPDSDARNYCPCQTGRLPQSFVGNDYFCDSGSDEFIEHQPAQFYGTDPLWDGAGCSGNNTCCTFNTPPWFYKQLPQPTTDNIEMRVCRDEAPSNEDIAIVEIEIYVQ